MHKRIFFVDTNKLIALSQKLLTTISDHEVKFYKKVVLENDCYISGYVLFEIWKTLGKRFHTRYNNQLLYDVFETF